MPELTYVEESDYEDACDSDEGWCTTCKKFSGECVEPDAEGYPCDICNTNSVIGAENALIAGYIAFFEDGESSSSSDDYDNGNDSDEEDES